MKNTQYYYIRKTYVMFIYPGAFFSDESVSEVETRKVSNVNVPKNCFAFNFFDIISMEVEVDGNSVELTSKRINQSPRHYYGGKVYTVDEIKRNFSKEDVLIRNLEENGFKRAIKCRTGNWQAFDDEDIFVEESVEPASVKRNK